MNVNEESINAYMNGLLDRVVASTEMHGGKELLDSIILTGSLGRNEPTIEIVDNGNLKLISDVEIAFVHPRRTKEVLKMIDAICLEFDEELNIFPLSTKRVKHVLNYNHSLFVPKYKTIFTFDLFNGSRTIWGEDYLKNRKVSISECDLYEAKRLVANRIGELVHISINEEGNDLLRAQWKGKVMLAITSAYLILSGKYVSSYHGQRNEIISAKDDAQRLIGEGFIEMYTKSFEFLRESGELYEVPDEDLRRFTKNIGILLDKNNVCKPKVTSFSRKMKYFTRYIKTGCHFGIVGFENNILDALIHDYANGSDKVIYDAEIWKKAIY